MKLNNLICLIILFIVIIYLLNNCQESFKLPDIIYICENSTELAPPTPTPTPTPLPKCIIDENTNYYGNTYNTIKTKNYQACCDSCLNDPTKCRSWSYDSGEQICRLKYQMATNKSKCDKTISGYPRNTITSCNRSPKILLNNFNCQKSKYVQNALESTNKFTLILDANIISPLEKNWSHLLHAGDQNYNRQTPGIWLNSDGLHIKATTDHNNSEGDIIKSKLKNGRTYQLVIVYNQNQIIIYMDKRQISIIQTKGTILAEKNLYIGQVSKFKGSPINLTLKYLPAALDKTEILNCWSKLFGK